MQLGVFHTHKQNTTLANGGPPVSMTGLWLKGIFVMEDFQGVSQVALFAC